MRSALVLCCAALAALALASCGDSGPSTEEEVREAAVKSLETEDAKAFCDGMVSDHFLEVVYGGNVRQCVESDDGRVDAGKARASAVKLDPKDESRAEVAVEVSGGEQDGAAGKVVMVEVEDGWKLDEFGDDFLRSALLAGIESGDEGLVSTAQMRACFTRQFAKLDAATVRELAYASASEREEPVKQKLIAMAENCPVALADYVARTVTKGLVASGKRSPAFVRCIRVEMRGLLLLTQIAPELLDEHPGFAPKAALEGIVEGAKRNCLSG